MKSRALADTIALGFGYAINIHLGTMLDFGDNVHDGPNSLRTPDKSTKSPLGT